MEIYEKQTIEYIQGAILEPASPVEKIENNIATVWVPSFRKVRGKRSETDFYEIKVKLSNPMSGINHICPQKKYTHYDGWWMDHHEAAAVMALQKERRIGVQIYVTEEQMEKYLDGKDARMTDKELAESFNKGENYREKMWHLRRDIAKRTIMDEIFFYIEQDNSRLSNMVAENEEFQNFTNRINAIRKWSTVCRNNKMGMESIEEWEVTLAYMLSEEGMISNSTMINASKRSIKKLSEIVLEDRYLKSKQQILERLF